MHIPEQAIEAASKAYAESGPAPATWQNASDRHQELTRRRMTITLQAALPHLAPRTITTLEEWHALPYGSVVIGRHGEVILKDELGQDYGFMPYRLGGISEDVDGEFPATVVHTPSAPAGDR